MRKTLSPALAAALTVALSAAAAGQTPDDEVRREIEALKQGQQQIRQELQEIKRLLQERPAAPAGPDVKDKVFDIGDNPVKGEQTARLTLIEFTDYQ